MNTLGTFHFFFLQNEKEVLLVGGMYKPKRGEGKVDFKFGVIR